MTTNYDTIIARSNAARDAADLLDRLTADCGNADECIHDHINYALRDLLIDDDAPRDDDSLLSPELFALLRSLLDTIRADEYSTERMTALLLSFSLCPMHRIDYAICFDDDDPECDQIRAIHPNHDT